MTRSTALLLAFFVFLVACTTNHHFPAPILQDNWKVQVIPASPQNLDGDPKKGWEYVIDGAYIGSGVPFALLEKRFKKPQDTVLNRQGAAKNLPYALNVFSAPNGVLVANGSCLTCHAGSINGNVHIGLGNSFSDFRQNFEPLSRLLHLGVRLKYGKNTPEWTAFEDFDRYFKAIGPAIRTNQPGVNPAANLAEACVAYRNPVDLTYTEVPGFQLPGYTLATDVPPLWNLRKKHALYYTAVGRGDFTKLLFQASVLGIPDSTAAREAVRNFKDVVAWLRTLEPPVYPAKTDQPLAARGEILFNKHCSSCHGTYGTKESYPNKVVSLQHIGTDPYYATYAVQAPIVAWYNKSWFGTSEPKSYFEPVAGYIAPPLDGVWATAPYLHNGSVPTLEELLNSTQRPKYWARKKEEKSMYDFNKVGWQYTRKTSGRGKWTYDTTLPGYGNAGHTFGDRLSAPERAAVIEYLKTL